MGGTRELARRALRSADFRWAVGLGLLALGLRLAFVLAYGRTVTYDPGADFAFNDTFFYSWTGAAIAQGDGFTFLGHETAHWPPGYSYLLAGVYTVFGADTQNALIANAFLGALTVPLVYLIGLRSLGRRAAIVAAAALAVFPGQILIADVALSETLYIFELVAFIVLAMTIGRSRRALIALGVFAGLTALTRGEGILFPLIVLAMWWTPGVRGARKPALVHAAVVAGVMLLTIAPWTIRNAGVAHGFVPVGTNASATLWSGHNPDADGGPVYQSPAELARLSKLSEADSAADQRAEAIDWAIHHPLRELELIPLKLRALARGDALLVERWINAAGQRPLGETEAAIASRLANLASYGLLVLLFVSLVLAGRSLWRIPAMRAILVFLALAVPLYGFVYYGNVRYRVPLEPLMLLVVAGALTPQLARVSGRRSAGTAASPRSDNRSAPAPPPAPIPSR
jgi:4-amino-4-deoxy-L-arabinose transferase-like glycosyltransferase